MSTFEAAFDDSAALGAPADVAASPWVVMKFGGTSVSSVENWETIARLVQARLAAGLKPVIVHSALATVSNRLQQALEAAVDGDYEQEYTAIADLHLSLCDELGLDGAIA